VFVDLHARYRIVSLVEGLLDVKEEDDAVHQVLTWSHYADQFQGICLALDPAHFENGIRKGGFRVAYNPERRSLPPSDYDCWQALMSESPGAVHSLDRASGLFLAAADRAQLEHNRLLSLLTHKSPAWAYEHEIRMIYELSTLVASDQYRKVELPCEACRGKGKRPSECANASYRDALYLPGQAVRAVIFGTDCPHESVASVLAVLSQPDYSHVDLYWCTLHSSRYRVQYVKSDRDYVTFIQQHRAKAIAQAKRHIYRKGDSLAMRSARKGINYPPDRSPTSEEGTVPS
jgi:hypothetical protein